MRFSEISNTVHDTLKCTINVNDNILKMRNVFAQKSRALQTDPGMNLLPDPTTTKSNVMAVVAITPNYEIVHYLKKLQVRDPIFARPMFSRVRNVMKLSFSLYNHGNYTKIENACKFAKYWCFEA